MCWCVCHSCGQCLIDVIYPYRIPSSLICHPQDLSRWSYVSMCLSLFTDYDRCGRKPRRRAESRVLLPTMGSGGSLPLLLLQGNSIYSFFILSLFLPLWFELKFVSNCLMDRVETFILTWVKPKLFVKHYREVDIFDFEWNIYIGWSVMKSGSDTDDALTMNCNDFHDQL